MKSNHDFLWLLVPAVIVILGIGVWWQFFHDPYRPTAYLGYTVPYGQGAEEEAVNFTSYVMEVDLLDGVVVDTFPLSKDVPYVKSVAVNPERNLLYAAGRGFSRGPEGYRIPAKGVDVYDLGTEEKVDTFQFPSFETGEPRGTNVAVLRYVPGSGYLLLDNPLRRSERETEAERKKQLILDARTGEVVQYANFPLRSLNYISPEVKYVYSFGLETFSRMVFSVEKEKLVEFIKGKRKLAETGGWHPDPEGKYEKEPHTLNYPEIWPRGEAGEVIEFYDRDTMKKTGELQLEKETEDIESASSPRQPDAVNKTGRYTVSLVWMNPGGAGDSALPYLKVIDLKKRKLVDTIQLGGPGEIREMTYADVH